MDIDSTGFHKTVLTMNIDLTGFHKTVLTMNIDSTGFHKTVIKTYKTLINLKILQ